MARYRLTAAPHTVLDTLTGGWIPTNAPTNTEAREYAAWLAAGNTPDPYEPPEGVNQEALSKLLGG